jgi:hypothetical protein
MKIKYKYKIGQNKLEPIFLNVIKIRWIVYFGIQLQGKKIYLYNYSKNILSTQLNMKQFSNFFKEILLNSKIKMLQLKMVMF